MYTSSYSSKTSMRISIFSFIAAFAYCFSLYAAYIDRETCARAVVFLFNERPQTLTIDGRLMELGARDSTGGFFATVTRSSGTAFLLRQSNNCYLATASHVVAPMRGRILVCFADINNRPVNLPLDTIVLSTNEPIWAHHPIGDAAVIQIGTNSPYSAYLLSLSLDSSILVDSIPSRTEELVVYGFPLSLGHSAYFSPITWRTYAASSLLVLRRADTGTPQHCFALEDTTIQGFSGGPVMKLSVYTMGNYMQIGAGPAMLYGLVHGTLPDDYGQSMAIVTCAAYLKELLLEYDHRINEAEGVSEAQAVRR